MFLGSPVFSSWSDGSSQQTDEVTTREAVCSLNCSPNRRHNRFVQKLLLATMCPLQSTVWLQYATRWQHLFSSSSELPCTPTAEQQSELGAQLLVSHAIDEGAEEARQDVGEHEADVENVHEGGGEGLDEVHGDDGRGVGQHAQQQLDPVQQDGVPRLPGRRLQGAAVCSVDAPHDL